MNDAPGPPIPDDVRPAPPGRRPAAVLPPLAAGCLDDSEFRRLAEHQPTLCWIADGSGYIHWYNRSWHRYCGTRPADMEGWGWVAVHDPDVLPEVQARWTAAIAAGDTFEMVFPLRGADGIFRPFLTRAVPLRDRSGRPVRWFGNNVDVSAQVEIERELRRSRQRLSELNDTLEARIVERTEGLRLAEEQLRQSQKLEAIGHLTGGVAHDFNNLLTVIKGSVELLRRDDLPPSRRDRYIDSIAETADRAARLTSQLLAFARRQALTPEIFDVAASLGTLGAMLATLVGTRITLDTRLPATPCHALADRNQFDTAIVNLVINARDAMQGEGRVTIGIAPVSALPSIRTHPPVPGDYLAVTILDTGTGIAPDRIDRIFEPFFTTKGAGAGTGLGLSQVIGFAKQSGGDIDVDSVPGEGARFTLYLPRANAPAHAPADAPAIGPARAAEPMPGTEGGGIRVLVVEDNRDVGAFAVRALDELGYDSVLAADAACALAELERDANRFRIVFSDVVMPGMDGVALAREIRARHPAIPVVLTSGYSDVLVRDGHDGFELLGKPYSIEQLSRTLHRALGAAGDRPAARRDLRARPVPADPAPERSLDGSRA